MRARAVAAALPAMGGLLALSACESSQHKSDRLRAQGATAAELTSVKAGAPNADVKVAGTTILRSAGGTAVVVELKSTGTVDQVAVPIQIRAKDAKGADVYKNDLDGLQTSLQQLALLRRGKTAYWVNDQVTAPSKPARVVVQVGRPKGKPAARLPRIRLSGVRMDADDVSGAFLRGIVRNESTLPQVNMPIYAVARKGGKVVAAGRALIERLDPEPQKKPTVFRIFFIGDPKGGTLSLEAEPTVLRAEGT